MCVWEASSFNHWAAPLIQVVGSPVLMLSATSIPHLPLLFLFPGSHANITPGPPAVRRPLGRDDNMKLMLLLIRICRTRTQKVIIEKLLYSRGIKVLLVFPDYPFLVLHLLVLLLPHGLES